MSDLAIRARGLGKRYRIGAAAASYRTIREAIVDAARSPFRNLRRLRALRDAEEAETFWALRNVSFDVKHGEVLGIVGRNGAGKSTLLKVLARITEPSAGCAEVNGRIGSLLEVGTGFHPELSGRENVFLNGSILGMDRAYILTKFDEMIEFAGVEQFIDTPVKRYSSGMYLRLAFAVAAFLEPEILIVDEVLAVGDAEFQQKCLGRMGEVAKEGRTVLFVSHNMQAISQLTRRCIFLTRGGCGFDGPTAAAIQEYLRSGSDTRAPAIYHATPDSPGCRILRAQVCTSEAEGVHAWGQSLAFEFDLAVTVPQDSLCFSFQVVDESQRPVCHFWHFDVDECRGTPGIFRLRCEVPKMRLYMGTYTVTTWLADRRGDVMHESLAGICAFQVSMLRAHRDQYDWAPGACVYLEDAVWRPVEQLTISN